MSRTLNRLRAQLAALRAFAKAQAYWQARYNKTFKGQEFAVGRNRTVPTYLEQPNRRTRRQLVVLERRAKKAGLW